MGRFTGVVLALAVAAGCATKKEDHPASRGPAGGGATNSETNANEPTQDRAPDPSQGVTTPTPPDDSPMPLDPSANADPNSAKQQARANGLLGATDQFDDSPVDSKPAHGSGSQPAKGNGAKIGQGSGPKTGAQAPGGGTSDQLVLDLDTPDTAVKTALGAQRDALWGCHTGLGTLTLTISVDANGKVTSVKLTTSSIRGAKPASDCVVAVIKKLQLPKGTKVTAPVKLTFK